MLGALQLMSNAAPRQNQMLNSNSVSKLYKNDKLAKMVMDYITLRMKGATEFFAHTLVEELHIKHTDVVEVFKLLELTGFGVWFRGRAAPNRTRFEAVYKTEELERAMHDSKFSAGQPFRTINRHWLDKGHAPLIRLTSVAKKPEAEPTSYNTFTIRPDFVLRIPADLSDTDKKKLVDFVNLVK